MADRDRIRLCRSVKITMHSFMLYFSLHTGMHGPLLKQRTKTHSKETSATERTLNFNLISVIYDYAINNDNKNNMSLL